MGQTQSSELICIGNLRRFPTRIQWNHSETHVKLAIRLFLIYAEEVQQMSHFGIHSFDIFKTFSYISLWGQLAHTTSGTHAGHDPDSQVLGSVSWYRKL